MELVFEDVSTFEAENSVVGPLLREIDLNKKQTDSDFIKSLPSQRGKEFEIKKRLDRLRDSKKNSRKNNNNNNNSNNAGGNLFRGPGSDGDLLPPGPGPKPDPRPNLAFSPPALTINDFIQPAEYELQNRFNNLRGTSSPAPFFVNNAPNFNFPTSSISRKYTLSSGPGNTLFGSKAAELTREKVKDGDFVTETKNDMTIHFTSYQKILNLNWVMV